MCTASKKRMAAITNAQLYKARRQFSNRAATVLMYLRELNEKFF